VKAIEILKNCPDLDIEVVKEHIRLLGRRYSGKFSPSEICRHIKNLQSVLPENPVAVSVDGSYGSFNEVSSELFQSSGQSDGLRTINCTVTAFDYLFAFSMITGILSSLGMNIVSGEIFTLKAVKYSRSGTLNTDRRRRIIDCFTGTLSAGINFSEWVFNLKTLLKEVFLLLEKGDETSIIRAKTVVNEMAARNIENSVNSSPVLYPIEIHFDDSIPEFNMMRVFTEDTPFFLYAMSTALSLQGISIEHVNIKTVEGRIEDEFLFTDLRKKRISDAVKLDRIKLSVLFTKQFTYFLSISPDPYSALIRFEELLHKMLMMPDKAEWLDILSDPDILSGLAKLLGVSDFLWEDFIRLHYETLIPMLKPYLKNRTFAENPESLCERFNDTMRNASGMEEKEKLLNEFKDREIFLLDLNHILMPEWDFRKLSLSLTLLAECIINYAFSTIYEALSLQYGRPRTVAGVEAQYAILGLGKMGGSALGYASDIEIMLVYDDNGETDGDKVIKNSEFFEELVKRAVRLIHSKREGIFHIDLRLRPYGNSGPLACSLDRFCRYYGRGGKAHSYERLALVRLRAIGGNSEFGSMVERLRDDMIYSYDSIDVKEIRDLREKQYREKAIKGRLNAKYSPGALVDLEYAVQILQVMYGGKYKELKTPHLHKALEGLAQAGVLEPDEAKGLIDAYYFLRKVINGLRMLRGSAKDLFLPGMDSREYDHLARRLNYKQQEGITPVQALHVDFEMHTARIRAFLNKYFGKTSIPGEGSGNIADLIMYGEISEKHKKRILTALGIKDVRKACLNLKKLSGKEKTRDLFVKLSVLSADILLHLADPDMALNNWERFTASLDDVGKNYSLLLFQPKRLDILLKIFSGSQFLSNTLIGNPEFFDWITISKNINGTRMQKEILYDLYEYTGIKTGTDREDYEGKLDRLRKFKKREILRIGTRDICFGKPILEIMSELSELADAVLKAVTEKRWAGAVAGPLKHFCIFAFGKLGGRELNYSSDIDLLAVYDDAELEDVNKQQLSEMMRSIVHDLSIHTDYGYCYRVDLRLRPYGSSGEVVHPFSGLLNYYKEKAKPWEIQALIKLRPAAGDIEFGRNVLDIIRPVAMGRFSREEIIKSAKMLRQHSGLTGDPHREESINIKTGPGGIRDIEFTVQVLQLVYGRINSNIIDGSTSGSVKKLESAGIITHETAVNLTEDYFFLRRIEHFLQIYEDRQIHLVPSESEKITVLARRVLDYRTNADIFMDKLAACRVRVRKVFEDTISAL